MALSNFERMIQLAEDTFAAKNDPEQLDVNQDIIVRLQRIYPAKVSEYDDGNGPVAWVLLIPTTLDLMNQFLVAVLIAAFSSTAWAQKKESGNNSFDALDRNRDGYLSKEEAAGVTGVKSVQNNLVVK